MFESLSDRLTGVFKKIRGHARLDESNIQEGLREVRLALLEADVNFKVVKGFVDRVKERAMGQDVLTSLTPGQQVVKIVHEELVELLGGESYDLELRGKGPTVIMMVGLQGSGKTTSSAKLALHLRKQNISSMLVPADVYRPAAIDQLHTLAKQLDIPAFPSTTDMNPVDIAARAVAQAEEEGIGAVLLDTAGRLHIDDELMAELAAIKDKVNPREILFVADAMTGQDAVTVAERFNDLLEISGVVLTKMDGDARGGAALSIKSVTGKPVKFVGVGEQLSAIEVFHPDRIAGRILGMGDVMTLVEKAQTEFDEEEAEKMAKKMQKATFDFEDFRVQMRRLKKLGSLGGLMKLIPGMGDVKKQLDDMGGVPEKELGKTEAIICSMTMQERHQPDIINPSRKERIAKGSGTTIKDVNLLIKNFEGMRKMMKQMMGGKGAKGRMPPGMAGAGGLGGMPGMPGMGGLPGMGGMDPGAGPSKSQFTKKKKSKRKKRKKR
ncbi:MAG: signal recognition particle protein [Desulfovibrio sp.]|nr:MAG: signal recognition particle protein [Desulfovibrio sp.]